MSAKFDLILDRLRETGRPVRMDGPNRARSSCPAHDGDNPGAVSIRDGATRVSLRCFTGECDGKAILEALGLSLADAYHEPRQTRHGEALATYVYDNGRRVHRTAGKAFPQDNGKVPSILFHRPRVVEAVAARQQVWVVEGEEDVLALESAGVCATTAPMGAGSFHLVDCSPLAGADVVAVVDRDEHGDRWATQVADKLAAVGARVRFVRARMGKDADDHITAGYGVEDFDPYPNPTQPVANDNSLPEVETPERASWAPVDLAAFLDGSYTAPEPELLPRADGVCLLYRGLTHSLHGESESGKSLLAQVEAVRILAAGGRVLFVDFESDPGSVASRLLEFGATPAQIAAGFVYVRPEVQPQASPAEAAAFLAHLRGKFDLAVIDGVTDALALWGAETKDNDGITRWARALPKAIADNTAAAVVMVDHVTKDTESRGRFAIGGQAKLAALTGAAYTVEVSQPLGRGLRGVIVLRVAKDRPGHVRGHSGPMRPSDRTQEAARVIIDSTGPRPVVTIEAPRTTTGSDARPWRPTAIMEAVSRLLEDAPEPMGSNAIDTAARGKAEHKRQALALLVAGGYVEVTNGPNRAKLHASVKPYRQTADPGSDQYQPPEDDGTHPSPEVVPEVGLGASLSIDRDTGRTHLSTSGTHPGRTGDAPTEPQECRVCAQPLHPSVTADGFTTCPSCEVIR